MSGLYVQNLSFSEPHWFLSCCLKDLCLDEGLFVVVGGVFCQNQECYEVEKDRQKSSLLTTKVTQSHEVLTQKIK